MLTEKDLLEKNGESATISKMDWFKLNLLSLIAIIPFIGAFVLLGVYIYLAVNDKTAKSIKNYLVIQFIIAAVAMVLGILFFTAFAAGIAGSLSIY